MSGELVSIPIQGGIDQSVAIALGEPRVWRLERARFVQPGEVVASPGYANDPHSLGVTASQHLVALGYSNVAGNWAVVSGNSNPTLYGTTWSTRLLRRDPVRGWLQSDHVSPAQAPRRHTLLTNAVPTSTPQIMKTVDPALVIVVNNETRLSYFKNGKVLQEKTLTYSPPGTPSDVTKFWAAGYCLIGAYGGVYTYDATADTFTRSVSYTPYQTLSVWSDPHFGLPGSVTQYCAVVTTTGAIVVYQWDGSALSTLGIVPSTDLPNVAPVGILPGTVSVSFSGNTMTRTAASAPTGSGALSLYCQAYGLPGLVLLGSDTIVNAGYDPTKGVAHSCMAADGFNWLVLPVIGAISCTVTVWLYDPLAHTTTLKATMPGRTLGGRIMPAPGESSVAASGGVLIPCHYGTDDDPTAELWFADENGAQLLTALHGSTVRWGGSNAQPADAAFIAMRSGFDHKETCALLLGAQSRINNTVAGGGANYRYANELVAIELGALPNGTVTVPGLGVHAPGYQHSPIEAYQQAADLVSGGVPVSIGNRLDSAGCLFSVPVPTVEAVTGAGLPNGTYLYTLLLELQDSQGRVTRSAPSIPVSVTTTTGTNKVNVTTLVNLPRIPGLSTDNASWVLYRTLADGTVFYRLTVLTGVDEVVFSDSTSDATLKASSILYTQGSGGGLSGITPSYGVPPCRCIWYGRDRVIVGGLELPRRVRWSKLFYPGEGVSFAHPSLAQWFYDVDDDVTAVAQLDDAWLVFCRTSIFAIYGNGPDDTGANGSFDAPRCISRSFGCHSPRSLLEIPEGVLFQGQDGGVYLVARGTLQVVWWSEKVRNLLGDVGTGLPMGWITAVIAHESKNTIHFVRDTSPPLVYDKRIQAWAVDTDWHSPGLIGAVAGCVAHLPAATQTLQNATDENFSLFIGTTDGHLIYEGCNNGVTITTGPDGTVKWKPLLETSDVSLFGLMGWGATSRISMLFGAGASAIPCETPVTVTIFNDQRRGDDVSTEVEVPHEFTHVSQYVTSVVAPQFPKASTVRLRVEWDKESFVGLAIEVDQKPRTERTTNNVRA